jgi:membrane protease YdiL (CAAX protease family)
MKTKFIQICYALILPIAFILILILLNIAPLPLMSKYSFGGIVVTVIALLLTYLAVKKNGKTFRDIGFYIDKKTPTRFLFGFLFGAVIAVVMFVIIISFSSIEISFNKESNVTGVLIWLLAFFPLSYMEEIIFRGYAFTKINNNVGIWPAQILLAILFTWYHDFTGGTFFIQLLGPGIWALIYGITAIWSKGISFPTGVHMALNVVIALVGQKDDKAGILKLEYPTDVTQSLKDEADSIGLIMQISILIIGIVLTEYYRRNKQKISKETY